MNTTTPTVKEEKIVNKVGFFDQADPLLEAALTTKEIREIIDGIPADEFIRRTERGGLAKVIPQFIYCNAVLSRSVSAKTKRVFYSCKIYISDPFSHTLSSDAFGENDYMRIMLDNDLNMKEAETVIPVRIRFLKGYSDQSLSEDHSFYAIEVIFPGKERKYIIRDFIKGGARSYVNLLSKKDRKYCEEKGIQYFSGAGFKLYLLKDDKVVANLWANFTDDEE